MSRPSKWILRALGGAIMALALTGPAPGNVGGCGSTTAVAAPVQFCTDRRAYECLRDHYAERIGDDALRDCLEAIEGACSGFVWPAGCAPTPARARACVELLGNPDLAHIPTPELLMMHSECNLCM